MPFVSLGGAREADFHRLHRYVAPSPGRVAWCLERRIVELSSRALSGVEVARRERSEHPAGHVQPGPISVHMLPDVHLSSGSSIVLRRLHS